MTKRIQFTRDDTLHAALGVMPAFWLVANGHLRPGIAFAIGLLPTSLMGIAPTRKLRLVYGVVGCLFGAGVVVGSYLIALPHIALTAALFVATSYVATLLSTRRPAGGLLLSLIIPSMAVGTGYSLASGRSLGLAFVLGSLWSALASLPWKPFPPNPETRRNLLALQPTDPRAYGLLLGLTGATAILVGHALDPSHPGWTATAAMLVMRPLHDMVGRRGIARALSTVLGTLAVVATIHLDLSLTVTALLVSAVAVVTIGARTSRWYVTSFGTAFLILTMEMYGVPSVHDVRQIAGYRVVDNVVGAAIALLFGLAVPSLFARSRSSAPGDVEEAR